MKTYGGVEIQLHHLDLGTRWKYRFISREVPPPPNRWRGGWAGRRAGLDAVEKRKIMQRRILECLMNWEGCVRRWSWLNQISVIGKIIK
jgi:hypothetical protein